MGTAAAPDDRAVSPKTAALPPETEVRAGEPPSKKLIPFSK